MEEKAVIETSRLWLRKISEEDAPFFLKLLNSEAWLKYIGDRKVRTEEDAVAYIRKNYLPSYENHGFGSYLMTAKEGQEPIGACGLYQRDQLEHPDIGFSLLPEYMGLGFGYEAASAVMNYASKHLGIHKLFGITLPENKASIALLKKLGLHREGTFRFDSEDQELLLFTN